MSPFFLSSPHIVGLSRFLAESANAECASARTEFACDVIVAVTSAYPYCEHDWKVGVPKNSFQF